MANSSSAIPATSARTRLPYFAEAITRLEGATPHLREIIWLFIGGGALHSVFASELRGRGLQTVLFKPYQPRALLAQSLSAADIHLFSLKPELEGLIVPSKFYEIAAAGRPMIFIGDPDGEIATIVRQRDLGYAVGQGDGVGLAARIFSILSGSRPLPGDWDADREDYEDEFDKRIAINRWELLLANLAV